MAFVTSQLETLGMIEQPAWLWYGDWNEKINIANYIGENKKSDFCLATHENSDHSIHLATTVPHYSTWTTTFKN